MTTNATHHHYSPHETKNYKHVLQDSENDMIEKYILLMSEYLQYSIENTNGKDKIFFKFILLRGMETIHHVFFNLISI